MLYIDRIPAPPLNAFIASIWYCESPPRPFALQRVLPSGAAQLIVNLKEDQTRMYRPERGPGAMTTCGGTVLSGVSSQYSVIDTAEQECVAGVCFRPGGTVPFFAIPAHELRDAGVSLEFVWGRGGAARLREQLLAAPTPTAKLDTLERAMAGACKSCAPDQAVAFALGEFARRPEATRIAAVTARIGLSPRRFIERFAAAVGVTPKRYCRILRFQRALQGADLAGVDSTRVYLRHVDWTRIAMDCGYFDQAHFIHDFRLFAGITPTAYEAARTQFRNHVNFLQSDAALEVR
jgi:AraC-like DNA-binding protein